MDTLQVKGSSGRGSPGTTLGFFFGFAADSLYGPPSGNFKELIELSATMFGLLVATPSHTSSLPGIPLVTRGDTTGEKNIFFLLLLSVTGLSGVTALLHCFRSHDRPLRTEARLDNPHAARRYDENPPYIPLWQEQIAGIPKEQVPPSLASLRKTRQKPKGDR